MQTSTQCDWLMCNPCFEPWIKEIKREGKTFGEDGFI